MNALPTRSARFLGTTRTHQNEMENEMAQLGSRPCAQAVTYCVNQSGRHTNHAKEVMNNRLTGWHHSISLPCGDTSLGWNGGGCEHRPQRRSGVVLPLPKPVAATTVLLYVMALKGRRHVYRANDSIVDR